MDKKYRDLTALALGVTALAALAVDTWPSKKDRAVITEQQRTNGEETSVPGCLQKNGVLNGSYEADVKSLYAEIPDRPRTVRFDAETNKIYMFNARGQIGYQELPDPRPREKQILSILQSCIAVANGPK